MKDLYKRLKCIGFDAPFVRSYLLPDWWEDELGGVPANRAVAEMAIARHLGLRVDALRNPTQGLALPAMVNFRLKRNRNVEPAEVLPAVHVAQHAARLVADLQLNLTPYPGPLPAGQVRRAILRKQPQVDLQGLVRFCWDRGIIVVHLAKVPAGGKKVDGVAMFCDKRPVIVLASGKGGPPWLAFHLAHELGHLFRCHVQPGQPPIVDSDIAQVDDDGQEKEADDFACEVLTGFASVAFGLPLGLDSDKLATIAKRVGAQQAVNPGTVLLCHARATGEWPTAQIALKLLGLEKGAHRIIAAEVHKRLKDADMPESTERFLEVLSKAS